MNAPALFLSRLWMDDLVQSRRRSADLSDMANVHRLVMSLFGDLETGSPRASGGILFRSEVIGRRPGLLVQSMVAPQTDRPVETKDASVVLSGLSTGRAVRLQLLANTVRRDSKTGSDKSVPRDELVSWFRSKLEPAVEIDELVDLRPGTLRCGPLTMSTGWIDAYAVVRDAERLNAMARGGAGRRKAYGCGLLSVLPLGAGS